MYVPFTPTPPTAEVPVRVRALCAEASVAPGVATLDAPEVEAEAAAAAAAVAEEPVSVCGVRGVCAVAGVAVGFADFFSSDACAFSCAYSIVYIGADTCWPTSSAVSLERERERAEASELERKRARERTRKHKRARARERKEERARERVTEIKRQR